MPLLWESASLSLTAMYDLGKVKPHRAECREREILPIGSAGVACDLLRAAEEVRRLRAFL